MKRIIFLVVSFLMLTSVRAEERQWDLPENESGFSWVDRLNVEYGDFVFQTPFVDTSLAYLYDFVGKESLFAAEGTIIRHRKIENLGITFGGAFDASNQDEGELRDRARELLQSGTPYLGVRYVYDLTKRLHLGAFLGRNFSEGTTIAGVKTDFNVRFW